MFYNIKSDIIYYKTATDFELEFNLCGTCRMRLLSDKMQDKKSFVHSLARAVSRSSIILIAGPLFDENGTIATVCEAINTTTEKVDNAAFGISGDYDINIIKDSTPLVTSDGYFGGCIIESGPQTMILLTDNKEIRKTIMKELIHPYVEELYTTQISAEDDTLVLDTDEETFEEIEYNSEDLPIEESLEDTKETHEDKNSEAPLEESDEIFSDSKLIEEDIEPETDTIDLFVEPTKIDRETVERYTTEYAISEDEFNYDEDEYYEEAPRKNKTGLSWAVLIISMFLLLITIVLCYCIFIFPSRHGVSPVANLQEIYHTLFG